jgi:putative membrane protein
MMRWHGLLLVMVAGGLVTLPAVADDKDPKDLSDTEFVVKAVECGVGHVKLHQLAERKAQNQAVKDFAARMARECNRGNERLMEQAKGMKIAVVAGLEKERRERLDQLGKLEGAGFDREYLKQVIADQEKGVKMLESRDKVGQNAELKTRANEGLKAVREQTKEAKDLL